MTILACPLSWLCRDWQDTSILHMPFLYRDLTAVKALLKSKLPYKPAGIKPQIKVPKLACFFWAGSLMARNLKLHIKSSRKQICWHAIIQDALFSKLVLHCLLHWKKQNQETKTELLEWWTPYRLQNWAGFKWELETCVIFYMSAPTLSLVKLWNGKWS